MNAFDHTAIDYTVLPQCHISHPITGVAKDMEAVLKAIAQLALFEVHKICSGMGSGGVVTCQVYPPAKRGVFANKLIKEGGLKLYPFTMQLTKLEGEKK